MDKIRQWTLMISAVAIISGVLVSLLPKSNQKNLYKVIVGIVLIYAMLQPFVGSNGIEFDIRDFLNDNYSVSENIDKYAHSALLDSAEKSVNALLSDEAEKLNVSCTFSCECIVENSQVKVDKIKVYKELDKNEKLLITEMIKSMGFDEKIIVFAGEEDEYR